MAKDDLKEYQDKRDFKKTKEPAGKKKTGKKEDRIFVVQRHDATNLHYDFRLEYQGVLLSWAVPKGPSMNPKEKRLAVHVENHPYDYHTFEGTIPKGEYGGGVVQLFDRGTWEPLGDTDQMMTKGDFKFRLFGERLQGNFVLVRMKPKNGEEEDKNWLLIKEKDDFVDETFKIDAYQDSISSGKTLEEIGPDFYESDQKGEKAEVEKKTPKPKKRTQTREEKTSTEKRTSGKSTSGKTRKGKNIPFEATEVMLAKLQEKVPLGKEWVYELKYDGYRLLAYKNESEVRLITRNGQDYSTKFKKLSQALKEWPRDHFVLDGEVVIFDKGRTDFQALQRHLKEEKGQVVYMAFDLLALDGEDYRPLDLLQRKQALKDLLEDAPTDLRFSSHTSGNGQEIFEALCQQEMEGLVAKKTNSSYTPGRNGHWVKVKCDRRQEFIIVGYTQTDKRKNGVSALLVGVKEGEKIIYRGRAGTGFTETEAKDLEKKLKALGRKTSQVIKMPKARSNEELFYVKPELVAEIKYAEITSDGLLRQASFKGLREDKPAEEVILEEEALKEEEQLKEGQSKVSTKETKKRANKSSTKETSNSATKKNKAETEPSDDENKDHQLTLTSPDKVMFSGVSKEEIAAYYDAVAKRMMPWAKNRLLSLVRCPDGEKGQCFYQKHMNHDMPGMAEKTIEENDGDKVPYYYLEDQEGLHSAVQYGTIEFHGWGSRVQSLEQPDWLVFDLDPDEGMAIDRVRQGVKDLKTILDGLELEAYLKTSGGKGYHVMVPLDPQADWEVVRNFCKNVAQAMEKKWPKKYTANMSKEKRKGRIYIDWVRNGRTATSVLPYSLRARKNLPVSAPITWEELDTIHPSDITIKNIKERLKVDPWKDMAKAAQSLK